jgi:putative ABC transport system permease protein
VYLIALKMLLGDKAKYLMLMSALTFVSLLMTQQSSVFSGLMLWTTATLRNTGVPIWVMDPKVEQVNEVIPLLDTDVARVRSVRGVEWAVPFFFSMQQARLKGGNFQTIQLFGLDTSSLIGAPQEMIEGRLQDLRQANAVIVDEIGLKKMNQGSLVPLKVGDFFEINDKEALIVGICKAAPSFFGYPFVYTTYERALDIIPKGRKTLSFILVKPSLELSADQVATYIEETTQLKATTEDKFFWETINWYVKNTGIPISFGTTILLGLLVGIGVAGQTFYTFILENLGNLGALKAMGASNALLCRMLIFQAFVVGLIGYGIGVGLASVFGFMTLKSHQPPFFMPYQIPLFTLGAIIFICSTSALIGIRKISQLQPAEVFRG